jgi:hypothetical protein
LLSFIFSLFGYLFCLLFFSWELFYRHLKNNKRICPVGTGDPTLLAKTSRAVMKQIMNKDPDWKNWVPKEALKIIERQFSQTL